MEKTALNSEQSQRFSLEHFLLGVHTSMPGVIESFDTSKNLAEVRPAIKMKAQKPGQAEPSFLDLPVIRNVPICLPASKQAGLIITVPIEKGDTCLLVFSERAIDNFVKTGGVVVPIEGVKQVSPRHHDITDAICIPGLTTLAGAISNWSQTAIEIRNTNRSIYLSVSGSGISIKGNVIVDGDVTADGISLKTHRHTDPQGGQTGQPISV